MSAYDMKFSDSIYGSCQRYVSRDRLQSMLNHEYKLLNERLGEIRGATSAFFAFANTVAARSFSQEQDGHGWLGIRFQTRPGEAASQIDLHVQLKGQENVQDQETLGLLGVNLIYAALHLHDAPDALLASLLDGLSTDLLSINHSWQFFLIRYWKKYAMGNPTGRPWCRRKWRKSSTTNACLIARARSLSEISDRSEGKTG